MEKSEIGKRGDGFIDRSKVRILLCDNDDKCSEEIFTLLGKCSYQVTCVKSPRQVIDALNAEGPDIDIILSEVDLPMSKGLKMLKYIMRDKGLRRIPVIMMSAQDDVSIVVKCLKFGAADYLVKPLRTNELLNLWTHMWRRRRMLGLVEKSLVNNDFDVVASDPSDANTSSTTLFSDETEKSSNHETGVSTPQEEEANATPTVALVGTFIWAPSECQPDVPGICDRRTRESMKGQISSFPRSELKIGESSAFFTYVKSSTPKTHEGSCAHESAPKNVKILENVPIVSGQEQENPSKRYELTSSYSMPDSFSIEGSSTISLLKNSKRESSHTHIHSRNDSPNGVNSCYAQTPYPYYMSGVMNQFPGVTFPPTQPTQPPHTLLQCGPHPGPAQYTQSGPSPGHHPGPALIPLCYGPSPDMHNHVNSTILPHYNHAPQYPPHVQGMAPYPYYPFGMCLQPGQMPPAQHHPWPNEVKLSKVDLREAALMKFRQKRNQRCFDKKIRYVNRKKLAESRSRMRGQFVRKGKGVNVDLNGVPDSMEDEEEEEEYDEEDRSASMVFFD